MSRWPRRVLDGFGYVAYVVVYRILRWRRALSATNIANAFPEKTAEERAGDPAAIVPQPRPLPRRVAVGLERERRGARQPRAHREPGAHHALHGARASRSCCSPRTSATGSGCCSPPASCSRSRSTPCTSRSGCSGIDDFLRARRARFGGNPIPHQSFMFEVMKRRKDVRAYALVADHTPKHDEEKHWTRFLNQDTAFFVGADKIAKILKAPVIYVAMRRDGPGRYSVELKLLAEPPYDARRRGRRSSSATRACSSRRSGAAPPIGCGCTASGSTTSRCTLTESLALPTRGARAGVRGRRSLALPPVSAPGTPPSCAPSDIRRNR